MTRSFIGAALLGASLTLGGCMTAEERFLGAPPGSLEPEKEGPIKPGFESQTGCQRGFHGVPTYRGNGFRCVQNGY